MFKKDKTEEEKVADGAKQEEETAYEDSWYRSLKAMSKRPADEDEEVGAPED